MKILHISLTEQGKDYASLHYFWDNPNDYKEHKLPLAEIKKLSDRAETDYYTYLPVENEKTGQALYNWLDKSDRILANALQEAHPEGLIIASATDKGLAHLPWELLHDGKSFLVQKRPSIIPIRWVSNAKADKALESELRQLKDELSKENFCYQLEDYLRQGDWRKADEETAWLFYKVMVLQEYRNWTDLFDNFPNSILQELDRLWVTSSHGNFGFSVQKRIWTDIGGNLNPDNERWDSYGEQIGWYRSNELWNSWEGYNASSFTLESQGNLPALPYIRGELKSLPWDSSNEGLNSFLAKYYGRNTFQLCARTDLMKEGEEVVLMAGWMGWWHLFFHNKI